MGSQESRPCRFVDFCAKRLMTEKSTRQLELIIVSLFRVLSESGLIKAVGDCAIFLINHSGKNMSVEQIMKSMDRIEADLNSFTSNSKSELENIGNQQRDLAHRLAKLERYETGKPVVDWAEQVIENAAFNDFLSGNRGKAKFEVKNNTLTGSDTTVAPDRRPGVVPGATTPLTVESLFEHVPTESNAVEFMRENVFTNGAAEAAEGATKSESSLTWSLVNVPVSTVAHWIKITKQLMEDHVALAAYVNNRLAYGVNRRVETQLVTGNGTAPNIGGMLKSGNYTVHAYTDAMLGSGLKKHKLLRMVVADLKASGYTPSAILLNPSDWLLFEMDMINQTAASLTVSDLANGFPLQLFGVPVIESIGVTADTFAILDAAQTGRIYDRQEVTVEFSESDSDNFVKNLITVRAERRLALAIDQPAAIRGGDLTPA